MRRCALFVVLALASCGRLNFTPAAANAGDGAIDAPRYALDAGECPPGYMFAGASCYRISLGTGSGAAAWLAAEAACEADAVGAHLVVLDSMAEMMVVDGIVPGNTLDHWIGTSDLVSEGTFVTVTNLPLAYTNWNGGAPNGGASENCVVFNDDTTLYDNGCSNLDDFVCEYDGIAAVHAAWGQ